MVARVGVEGPDAILAVVHQADRQMLVGQRDVVGEVVDARHAQAGLPGRCSVRPRSFGILSNLMGSRSRGLWLLRSLPRRRPTWAWVLQQLQGPGGQLPFLPLEPLLAGYAVLARGTADPFGATWNGPGPGPRHAPSGLAVITRPAR